MIKQTAQRLADLKQKQIEEMQVLEQVILKRIKKLTEKKDIAEQEIIISRIKSEIEKSEKEMNEFSEIANDK